MENESEIIRKWKKIYEEGMDFMANWVVPLYNTCFCTILVKAVKADLNKSNNSSEIIQTTFEILADYIDEGKIKFEPHISESVCNSVKRKPDMVRKLSDYIIETLTPVEEIEAPITCNELDQMIPKKGGWPLSELYKDPIYGSKESGCRRTKEKLIQDFLQLSGAYPTLPQKFGSKKFK